MKPGRRGARRSAPARRSSGKKAFTALAVVGGFALLYGWNSFFLAPKGKAKEEVHKQVAAARQQADELRRNLAELRRLANDTKAREAELTRLRRLVPADPDLPGAILAFNETAHQAHVEMSSFVPSLPGPGAAGSSSISVTVNIAGTFGQLYDYLWRLESLDRLVVVDSLQLTAAAAGAGSPRINANISARMFSGGAASPAATTVAAGHTASPSGSTALPKAGG